MFIIATVGLNKTEEKARKVLLSGAEAIRFNLSRYTPEVNLNIIKITENIIDELNSNTKIILDMPINKIRLGDFDIKDFAVREGEEFYFKSGSYTLDCNQFIPVKTSGLGEKVNLHQTISIGDGEVSIQVVEIIDQETIKARILNNGILQYYRTFNIPCRLRNDEFIKHYTEIFEQMKNVNADYIAISYVDRQINEIIKKIIQERGKPYKVIIKIEEQNGIDDAENILQDNFYDSMLLDRGEIGTNVPYQRLGVIQKNLIKLAKKYNKPIIISTQILESTINSYIPSRAEISDITNMVLDGVSGLMFCRETGLNTRPAYTISVAKKIIAEAEKYKQSLTLQ